MHKIIRWFEMIGLLFAYALDDPFVRLIVGQIVILAGTVIGFLSSGMVMVLMIPVVIVGFVMTISGAEGTSRELMISRTLFRVLENNARAELLASAPGAETEPQEECYA